MRNLFLILISISYYFPVQAMNKTPNYYKCSNRVSGKWVFGIAPRACSVDPFISKNIVKDKFSAYTFDEKQSDAKERVRYVTELNTLLSKAADYYLKKRNPNVSSTELKWWRRIVLTIASHESFLTHYRDGKDKRLRMMRGDFGHGHGLMQIDDRWHFVNVENGTAAHLVKNIFYALDIYYAGWVKSKTARCISSSTDYYNRARAAYSVYNGGASRICRWTNPRDKWARNDKHFKSAFDSQRWKPFVDESLNVASVDIACLISDDTDCSGQGGNKPPKNPPQDPDFQNKVLSYKNFICALSDNTYYCLSQKKYRFCLVNEFNLINEIVKTNVDRPVVLLRPSQICPSEDKIYEVGSFIKVNKSINLRSTPGGRRIGLLPKNTSYQVLGSHINSNKDKSRYYLVRYRGRFGFFYAGNKNTAPDWATPSTNARELVLPVKGSNVKIQTRSGINLRHAPAGDKIGLARSRQTYEVIDTVYLGKTNKFYVKINVNGTQGWIYAGQIHPLYSIPRWIRIEDR